MSFISISSSVLKSKNVQNSNNSKEILNQNKKDVLRCDIVLSYIPRKIESRRPSYGTIFELSFAHSIKKDIILVLSDKESNLVQHRQCTLLPL